MPSQSHVGRRLGGRYDLERVLGEGAWGAVYEGVQIDLGRRVAVKVLHGELALSTEAVLRFEREAKAAAALGHPNIVQVTDFQANPGEPPFLVMERLEGETLASLLAREGRLESRRVAFIATQILGALGAAHRAGIVHRDIKPDNVFLVAATGVTDLVKLLDFGVAKLQREGAEITGDGALLGSPAYMAPEQIRGEAVDARADLWAVAVCMFKALTGRLPFDAASLHALMYAITDSAPRALTATRPDVDRGLVLALDRAMQKSPGARFQSADEMARAIAPFAGPGEPVKATVALPAAPSPHAVTLQPTPQGPPPPNAPSFAAAPLHALHAPPDAPAPGDGSRALIFVLAAFALLLALAGIGVAGAIFFAAGRGEGERADTSATATPAESAAPPPVAPSAAHAQTPTTSTAAPTAPTETAPQTPTAPSATAPSPKPPPAPTRELMGGPRAKFTGASWGVHDGVTSRRVVEGVTPALSRCWAATQYEPPRHQSMAFKLQIAPDGSVERVDPHGSEARCAKLDVCVGAALRAVRFAPTTSGRPMRISFTSPMPDDP